MPKKLARSSRLLQIKPFKDRRGPRGAPGSVRWLKGLLSRPVELQWHHKQLKPTFIERRRPQQTVSTESVSLLREDLHTLLVFYDQSTVMRHLTLVHNVLGRRGWDAVAGMASRVLHKALVQAEMLASHETPPSLLRMMGRLRVAIVAAESREARKLVPGDSWSTVEVSEATHEDFAQTERGWMETVSPHDASFDLMPDSR